MKKTIFSMAGALLLLSSCAVNQPSSTAGAGSLNKEYESQFNQGMVNLNTKNYDYAIKNFKKAVALKADSYRAYNLLGMAYFFKNEYHQARVNIEKAMAINKDFVESYSNLGSCYVMENNYAKAEGLFRKAMEMAPQKAAAYYQLGFLLLSQGRIKESSTYLTQAKKIDPEFLEKNKTFIADNPSLAIRDPEIWFQYAKLSASISDLEKTVRFLIQAKKEGFRDWQRIDQDPDFEKLRNAPEIRKIFEHP